MWWEKFYNGWIVSERIPQPVQGVWGLFGNRKWERTAVVITELLQYLQRVFDNHKLTEDAFKVVAK